MSEAKIDALYTRESHPHTGDSRVDPEERLKKETPDKKVINEMQELEKKAIYTNSDGKSVNLDPEIPYNHKWFNGEFHTSPWGSDQSPFGGRSSDRVRVSMMGKKLTPTIRSGIASVYGVVTAVIDPKDREFIGTSGWWRTENLSKSNKKTKRRAKV